MVLVLALPASAQSATMARSPMLHAEIGTLESIDFDNQQIVTFAVTDGDTTVRRFRTGETTMVQGLGDIMNVGEIPSDAYGRPVIVQFATEDGDAVAHRLQFPAATQLKVTRGIISRIDEAENRLTLAYAPGPDEIELGIGYGATIDSAEGLLELDDLRPGEAITVYYDAATDDVGIAYLLYQTS